MNKPVIDDPIEYIRGIIKAMGTTQKNFCLHAGIKPVHLAEFFSGVRGLSKANCLRLERAYGIPFLTLMTAQAHLWYKQNKDKEL